MSQETLLKEELKETRRANERAEGLNVEYLKNVLLAFLLKVYGDAENEEHIKLAHVLETLLRFSPEEKARLAEKIEYYETSWWHTTANLLKPSAAPDLTERSGERTDVPAASATQPAAAESGGFVTSLWSSVFGT
eukprot:CAMPEP_0115880798 /NCGR_PEP_ID=MMETSP0287-20121206/28074_1 /TAXON_ID=412157 /ORGANISM="Chrysochromulina rotalis, Strain UIO044" /LENGTH=134 /DNA_ID=CAMNT_0003336655 /DNA_START=18 /DNA_END=425 /DNA_ORIENTATION=+